MARASFQNTPASQTFRLVNRSIRIHERRGLSPDRGIDPWLEAKECERAHQKHKAIHRTVFYLHNLRLRLLGLQKRTCVFLIYRQV